MKNSEKTLSRIPFPVFQPGRLELRHLPEIRPGEEAPVRMAPGDRRCGRAIGMGAARYFVEDLPEILHHCRESDARRRIFCATPARGDGLRRIVCETG